MKIEDNHQIKFKNITNITNILYYIYLNYLKFGGSISDDPDLFDEVLSFPRNQQVVESVTNAIIFLRKTNYKNYLYILKALVIAGKTCADPDQLRPIDLFEFIYGGSSDQKDQDFLDEMRLELQPTLESTIRDEEERELFKSMVEATSIKEFDKYLFQSDELYLLEYLVKSALISVGQNLIQYDYFNFVESDEEMLFAEKYLTSKEFEELLLYTGLNIIEEDYGRIKYFLGGIYNYSKNYQSDIKAQQITFDFYKYIRRLSNKEQKAILDYAIVTSLYYQLKSISSVENDYYPEVVDKLECQEYNLEDFRKEMNSRKVPELFSLFLESHIVEDKNFQEIHSVIENSPEEKARLSKEILELKFRRFKKPLY